MHRDFATWLREVEIPGSETSKARERWEGVRELVKLTRGPEIVGMLRLLHRSRVPIIKETLERIVSCFSTHDGSFNQVDNKREIEVLCGAALSYIIETDDNYNLSAALAITTASFLGQRNIASAVDLTQRARDALNRLIEENQNPPSLEETRKKAIPGVDFEKAFSATTEGDEENFSSSMKIASTALKKSISTANEIIDEIVYTVDIHLRRQGEESQILWWLINNRSVDLDKTFDKLTPEEKTLVAPKELQNLIQLAPGPASVRGLLQRAGVKGAPKKTISSIVLGNDLDWLAKLVEDRPPCELTLPVHLAIKKQIENGKGDEWVANWSKVAGVDQNTMFSPLDIAHHFYYERLLLSELE